MARAASARRLGCTPSGRASSSKLLAVEGAPLLCLQDRHPPLVPAEGEGEGLGAGLQENHQDMPRRPATKPVGARGERTPRAGARRLWACSPYGLRGVRGWQARGSSAQAEADLTRWGGSRVGGGKCTG